MEKNKKTIIIGASVLVVAALAAFFYIKDSKKDSISEAQSDKTKAVVYKSPTCGCCVQYTSYLEGEGFETETVTTEDMASIKNKHKIGKEMESCHTAIIGDYFVEGHVPVEAVNKLLKEKPDIDGITLPEMPSGSPGMPGQKLEPFRIYGIKDGNVSDFISL